MEGIEQKVASGVRSTLYGVFLNGFLAAFKIFVGVVGGSYALIADGIESCTDIISSLIVLGGLKLAAVPADKEHPYGHGKAEAIAGLGVALMLLGAATLIVCQSTQQITRPHEVPKAYTLGALLVVIIIKEILFRYVNKVGTDIQSCAVEGDAWHHRSDAITSAAAFVGISIALIGGPKYASADDWAALAACSIIYFNGFRILRKAIDDLMDSAAPEAFVSWVCETSHTISGVAYVSECKVRKSGFVYWVEIQICVDGDISVREGHLIAHNVANCLQQERKDIANVLVHIEPSEPNTPQHF